MPPLNLCICHRTPVAQGSARCPSDIGARLRESQPLILIIINFKGKMPMGTHAVHITKPQSLLRMFYFRLLTQPHTYNTLMHHVWVDRDSASRWVGSTERAAALPFVSAKKKRSVSIQKPPVPECLCLEF